MKAAVKRAVKAKRLAKAKVGGVQVLRVSIAARKKAAMKSALSASGKKVDDVRSAFGFFPVGVNAEVVSWPKLSK